MTRDRSHDARRTSRCRRRAAPPELRRAVRCRGGQDALPVSAPPAFGTPSRVVRCESGLAPAPRLPCCLPPPACLFSPWSSTAAAAALLRHRHLAPGCEDQQRRADQRGLCLLHGARALPHLRMRVHVCRGGVMALPDMRRSGGVARTGRASPP